MRKYVNFLCILLELHQVKCGGISGFMLIRNLTISVYMISINKNET